MKTRFIHLFTSSVILLTILSMVHCYTDTKTEVQQQRTPQIEPDILAEQKLNLSVRTIDNNLVKSYSPEELNHQISTPLMIYGLKDVTIQLEDKEYQLTDAIGNKLVTIPLLFAYAQSDATNSLCTEYYTTRNGLTEFYYCYPKYTIRFVHDVYETPDGKHHLINEIALYKPNNVMPKYYTAEDGTLLDKEDWGVNFTVCSANNKSITISCTQENGQHLGLLEIWAYGLFTENPTSREKQIRNKEAVTMTPSITIHNNRTTEFCIDFTEAYGHLSTGQYILYLHIQDIYDPTTQHPLMKNFYDDQVYSISFSVP